MNQVNRFAISGLVAVAAAIGLAACGERVDTPDRMGQQGSGNSSMAQADRSKDQGAGGAMGGSPMGGGAGPATATSDALVSAAVKAALANDAQLQAAKVEVEAASGKVTLKGTAPDSATRDKAGQIVASVKGVTAVDNQINVAGS